MNGKENNTDQISERQTRLQREAKVVTTDEALSESRTRLAPTHSLYKHQQALLELNPAKHLLSWGTGTGKTIATLSIAKHNRVACLIIVPKGLVTNWERHVNQSSSPYRNQCHKIISKETFRRDWDILPAYQGVIVDECHAFASIKSQMSKALTKYIKKHSVHYRWFATATPYLSSPWNIYALANHLGANINYGAFNAKFFAQVRMGGRMIPITRKGMENELAAIVKAIGSTVSLEECIDMPAQTFEVEYFKLTPAQTKAIDTLEDIVHITRWTKTHQITGGSLKSDGYVQDAFYPCEKLDRLKEVITENPRSVVVCRYVNELYMLQQELKDIRPTHIISGDIPGPQRDLIIQSLQDSTVLYSARFCGVL